MLHRADRRRLDGRHVCGAAQPIGLSRIEIPPGHLTAANCAISIVFNLRITAIDGEAEAETQGRFLWEAIRSIPSGTRRPCPADLSAAIRTVARENVSRKSRLVTARGPWICKIRYAMATYPPLSLPSPGRFLPDLDRRRKPRGPFSWKTDCWKKRKQASRPSALDINLEDCEVMDEAINRCTIRRTAGWR
jgi:hypothetical protein